MDNPNVQPADIITRKARVSFTLTGVQPPSRVYLQQDDLVRVRCYTNNLSASQLTVTARILSPEGEIKPTVKTFPIAAAGLNVFDSFALTEGYLLSITFSNNIASTPGTFCYVACGIARNTTGVGQAHEQLFTGYIATNDAFGFPEFLPQRPTDGPGCIRSITGTTPSAGAEISETVPNNRRWELLTLRTTLTCSATVASRQTNLLLDDGSNTIWQWFPGNSITASNAAVINAAIRGYADLADGNHTPLALPSPCILQAGWRIRTSSASLQAGDQYAAPQYVVREWLDIQ